MYSKDKCKKKFPAMSAHFAYTLDDMKEKYIEIKFIELEEDHGIISEDDLAALKNSRENIIVFNDCLYRLMRIEANNYMYISLVTASDQTIVSMKEICVNINTGEYNSKTLIDDKSQEVADRIDSVEEEFQEVKETVAEMQTSVDSAVSKSEEALAAVVDISSDIEALTNLLNTKVSTSVERDLSVEENNYTLILTTDNI